MFNLFKKNEDTKENNVSLIAVCSLLIHSAKIDENYTEKEKNIIIKALIEMGAKDENLEEIIIFLTLSWESYFFLNILPILVKLNK